MPSIDQTTPDVASLVDVDVHDVDRVCTASVHELLQEGDVVGGAEGRVEAAVGGGHAVGHARGHCCHGGGVGQVGQQLQGSKAKLGGCKTGVTQPRDRAGAAEGLQLAEQLQGWDQAGLQPGLGCRRVRLGGCTAGLGVMSL